MKRFLSMTLCILMLLPLVLVAPVSAADELIYVGYSSPAICTDAGKTVDLSKVSVQFEEGANPAAPADTVWKDGDNTVTSYTPAEKGVYQLKATAGGKTKAVYVVAKNANETEYVLYENDFSTAPDLTKFRVIQQPSGTTFGYDEAETGIYLDASNDGANHMRVLLPSYLDSFGDAIYSARVKITKQTATSRFGAMIFRLQDPAGKKIPYMQSAFRYNISADNGLEIAERTASDSWSVTQKGPVTGVTGGSYFDVTVSFCGNVATSAVNGKTYLTENNTPYTSGAMGFQIRGARLTVDSVKITVNPASQLSRPRPQLRDTRDPDSNVVLEPALITEVKTAAELKALDTTLPAIAILDAAVESNTFGVILDGKFTKIADAAVCDRVIPAFRIDSSSEAQALAQYAGTLELCDAYVIASDPKLITEARGRFNKLYGMLDATAMNLSDEELRGKIIACGARGAILPESIAKRDYVSYLQDRYLVVWQAVTEKDISAVRAINNGVLGLITPDVKATEACFTKYYDANTLVRTPEIIGHRGVPSKAQENSLEGSIKAFELGATMVENDVYLMSDGNIVVMHDGTLDRTTNGTGSITAQTAETIKKFVIDGNASFPTTPIPLLKDYFEEFKGKEGDVIVVELKGSNTKIAEPLVKLIKEYGMERQVVIIAFNTSMISAMRKADPGISVNFLTSNITADEQRSLTIAQDILSTVIPLNTAYSPNQGSGTLGINLYTDLAVRGVTLWNWTVNNEDNFNKFFVSGIRGITTNYSQWAGTYVEDFTMDISAEGVIELNAKSYNGNKSSVKTAQLVVIGGTGTYQNGQVTLSEDAEGFFFKIKKLLSNGTPYYVVTPVVLKEDYSTTEPKPETTEEVTTGAPEAVIPTTDPTEVTDTVAKKQGCSSMISLSLIAILPATVFIIKKKED